MASTTLSSSLSEPRVNKPTQCVNLAKQYFSIFVPYIIYWYVMFTLVSLMRNSCDISHRGIGLSMVQLTVYNFKFSTNPYTKLPKYQLRWILWDILAGLVVSAMAIPQSMAYAVLAGLPAVYGLYATIIPSFIYLFIGTSRSLIVGPTAILALICYSFVRHDSVENAVSDAFLLSFTIGTVLLVASLARLGFLANLISKPIVTGFTAAAGVLISMSQVKSLLGIDMASVNTIIDFFSAFIPAVSTTNTWTLLMSVCVLIFLIVLKFFKVLKWVPGPLIAVIICTVLSWRFNLKDTANIKVLGDIPDSLPTPVVPISSWQDFVRALSVVPAAAGLAFVEQISIAKAFSRKDGCVLDPNRELLSISLVNLIGSFFSMFPATGSFTRTAVNFSVGAKSILSGVIMSSMVILAVKFMTPLLYHLPYCVLGAIIVAGTITLFDIEDAKFIFSTKKRDFVVLVASFLLTLLLGVETGIMMSVGVNALVFFLSMEWMKVEELGRADLSSGVEWVPITAEFNTGSSVALHPHIVIVRPSDSLCFANTERFCANVDSILLKAKQRNQERIIPLNVDAFMSLHSTERTHKRKADEATALLHTDHRPTTCLIIDMCFVNTIDTTALHALSEYVRRLESQDNTLVMFARVQLGVVELMYRANIAGSSRCYEQIDDAVFASHSLITREV